jgi:hypothetical protein
VIPSTLSAKPIIFNEADTRAILNTAYNYSPDGFIARKTESPTKTVIRIPLNPQPVYLGLDNDSLARRMYSWKRIICALNFYPESSIILEKLPYKKNDYLWVKEPWKIAAVVDQADAEHQLCFKTFIKIQYAADGEYADIDFGEKLNEQYIAELHEKSGRRWNTPVTMERPAARILLKIEDVRIEQVGNIISDDCYAEGIRIKPFGAFNPQRSENWDNLGEEKKNEYVQSAARAEYAEYIAGIEYAQASVNEFEKRWNVRYGKRKGLRFSDNPWAQAIRFSRIQ